jgi:hypothetical protein
MITFTGPLACLNTLPPQIGVVKDGDEKGEFLAMRQPSNSTWIGEWGDHDPQETFDADNRKVSVRLGSGRTGCRRSHAAKDPTAKDAAVAFLTFDCNGQPVKQVEIGARPGIPISYVRRLSREDGDPDSLDCVEFKNFGPLPVLIDDVLFDTGQVRSESLRVEIGSKTSDLNAPGLLVNHLSVLKHVKGRSGTLDRDKLITAFGEQRAEGLSYSPPLFASSAYDSDFEMLSKVTDDKQKKLEVTVGLK